MPFLNLLLILSVNNPTHMYLRDLRVYFKVEVYFRVTWSRMEDYYNGLCQHYQQFIVDRKVLFHSWWICSYLHISWSSDCLGSVQIGSLTMLWHDHIACIDNTARPQQKTAFWLMRMHWTVKPPLYSRFHFCSMEHAWKHELQKTSHFYLLGRGEEWGR